MMSAIDPSSYMTPDQRAAFERAWRPVCSCPRLSVREVDGQLRCSCCDAPILKRRRVEAEGLDGERRSA